MKTEILRIARIAALMAITLPTLQLTAQNSTDIKPSPQQVAWQDLEFGVIIHFGPNTFLNQEWGDGSADPKSFNPTQFDPDQWMKAIKASGAKYVVFVAKHHDGFCLWPTKQTDYSVKSSPWEDGKGDVVREVAKAARANGLRFGIYLSPWDRHEPKYKDPAAYDKYYLDELDELIQNYGDLTELWLDGAGSTGRTYDFPKIIEQLRTYQPNTIVFADMALFEYGDARWAGDESGKIEIRKTGTSSTVTATCAGGPSKSTRHCAPTIGSGIRAMKSRSNPLMILWTATKIPLVTVDSGWSASLPTIAASCRMPMSPACINSEKLSPRATLTTSRRSISPQTKIPPAHSTVMPTPSGPPPQVQPTQSSKCACPNHSPSITLSPWSG